MKEVESIKFVLENLEAIKFNREDIGILFINNIRRSISRNAVNSISDSIWAEEVSIQLSSNANKQKSYTTTYSESEPPFKRLLKHSDITALGVKYQNGEEEYVFVDWGGDSEYVNINQTSVLNEHTGDLYIVISGKETAESYFKEALEDKSAFYWDMYSEK